MEVKAMKKILAVLMAVLMLSSVMFAALADEFDPADTEDFVEVESFEEEIPEEEPAADPEPAEEEPEEELVADPEPEEEEPEEELVAEPEIVEEESEEEPAAEPEIAEDEPEEELVAEPEIAEDESEEELVAEPEIVEEEPEEEPAAEPEPAEDEEIAFTGTPDQLKVSQSSFEAGEIIRLKANVSNANMDYSISWEQMELSDPDEIWNSINGASGDVYELEATADCNGYAFRYVVEAEDGTVLASNPLILVVTVPEEEEEIAEEEAVEEQPAEEQPAEEQPAEKQAVEEQVAEEQPVEEQPVEEQPAEEQAVEEPAAEELVEEEAAEEQAAEEAEEETEEEQPVEEEKAEEQEKETAPAAAAVKDTENEEELIASEPVDEEKIFYVYKRDENGALILDEEGNPIALTDGEEEIPVTFQRDENGELVLDEDGDPIPTATVPADATKKLTLADALDENRTIDIYVSWNNEKPALNGGVTFIAVMKGYDNLEYTLQWQQSQDNENWYDISDANDFRYEEIITRENYKDFWRVRVTITGVVE